MAGYLLMSCPELSLIYNLLMKLTTKVDGNSGSLNDTLQTLNRQKILTLKDRKYESLHQ
jgi:hypothetical protein